MSVEAPVRPFIKKEVIRPFPFEGGPEPVASPENTFKPKSHETALIGMGAGNLGLMMHLDRNHQMDAALRRGVGFYDAQDFGSGTLNIACMSNSDGKDFTDGVRNDGSFAPVLAGSGIKNESDVIDLRRANTFYSDVGARLETIVGGAEYPASDVVKRRVSHITFNADHTVPNERFTLHSYNEETGESEVIGYSNKAVLGTGATQELSPYHRNRTDLENKSLYTAEQVMDGDQQNMAALFDRLASLPASERKVAILGVSHGGFAAAAEILKWEQGRIDAGNERILGNGSITMIGRHEPRVFAKDRAEAEEIYKGQKLDENRFAPNGAYERFGGIRALSKELYLKMRSEGPDQEKRVVMDIDTTIDNVWEDSRLDDKSVVIQAFGPSGNLVPVYDQEGQSILKFDNRGNLMVGANGNIETTAGEDIGLFSIGLGYPRKELSTNMLKYAGKGEHPAAVTSANAYADAIAEDVAAGVQFPQAA